MLKIQTQKQVEGRGLTLSEEDNLLMLFYRDTEYNSYFPFAIMDKTSDEHKFVGYAGALCPKDENDESFFQEFPEYVDLYICPNGMKTPFKRTKDNLINIQNIVIDIDSHNSELSIEELQDHIIQFENILLQELVIKPNYINHTGRGMHLWYCIEPCHVKLEKICTALIDMLCSNIETIITNTNESELALDRATSFKLNGLFRVPYSFNTKANLWTNGIFIHNEINNINELVKQLKNSGYNSEYHKVAKKKKQTKKNYTIRNKLSKDDYLPCLIHRKKYIDYIFETRDIDVGERDILLFASYSCLFKLYEKDDARNYLEELNAKIKKPLKYSELLCIFNEIEKKQHNFTVKKFHDFINATESEIEWFNKSTMKEEKKRDKRNKKTERNIKINELYNNGMSIVDISKLIGVSRPTIYKVLGK